MTFVVKYSSVLITLGLVTYAQLILKYQMNNLGTIPRTNLTDLRGYLFSLATSPAILSGLMAGFLAALSWMYTISRFELSSVYPFLSINFILVPLLSVYIFGESLNVYKIFGISIIVLGVLVFSRGT